MGVYSPEGLWKPGTLGLLYGGTLGLEVIGLLVGLVGLGDGRLKGRMLTVGFALSVGTETRGVVGDLAGAGVVGTVTGAVGMVGMVGLVSSPPPSIWFDTVGAGRKPEPGYLFCWLTGVCWLGTGGRLGFLDGLFEPMLGLLKRSTGLTPD